MRSGKGEGYKKIRPTGFGQLMGRSGAGFMIAAEGLMNTFTEVVPAFQQGGAKSGFKQIAKSGTKIVANTAGWLAGEAVGSAAGMAIGTALCPGIGTAIGKFVGGFLGGAIACHFAGKAATELTGKSEVELLKEKQLAEQTAQIENNEESQKQLAQTSIDYANEILKIDPQNKEALAALDSANNILNETKTNEAEQQNQQTQQPVQQQPQTPAYPQYTPQQTVTAALPFVPVVPGFNGSTYDMNIYNQMRQNASIYSIPTTQTAQAESQTTTPKNPFSASTPLQPAV